VFWNTFAAKIKSCISSFRWEEIPKKPVLLQWEEIGSAGTNGWQ
jgi:hypothetical protein